jgi:hypothetical protein
MNDTFKFFKDTMADKIDSIRADLGDTAADAYMVMLLLADERGVVSKVGAEAMIANLLNTGTVSYERGEDEYGKFCLVEWSPR